MNLTIDQALIKAVEAHKSGQLQDAERLYKAILFAQPRHPDANHNLGVLAFKAGMHETALPYLKAALEANPQQSQFWVSYINALIEIRQVVLASAALDEGKRLGLPDNALEQIEQKLTAAVPEKPQQSEIDALLSQYNAGNYPAAEQLAKVLTKLFPGDSFGWKALGTILKQTGRLQEALESMLLAAHTDPDDAEIHNNLSATFQDLGRLTESEASCREALRLKPDFAEAHNNLGTLLKDLGRLTEAEERFREAVRLKPDFAEAHNNLGNILKSLGRLTEAEGRFREALRHRPDFAEAHYNLGNVLNDLAQLMEAEASYREALRLKPDYSLAYSNLGVTLHDLGRLTEAEKCYREVLRLVPDYSKSYSNILFGLNYLESLSTESALREAKHFGSIISAKAQPKFTTWIANNEPNKLRIGFVSGDLRNHPVGYFIEGLIKQLDSARFDLSAFPTILKSDELTDRIKPMFKEWRPIVGKTDLEAATEIHQLGIDILIDLSGHTADNRLSIFSYRPAPVQVTWLGYFATSGIPEIDYILSSPHVTPVGEEWHFTENVWRLPETSLCFTPPDPPVEISRLPALDNGYITFGCFNNLTKVNSQVISVWAEILMRVPRSKLFLKAKQFADPRIIDQIRLAFSKHGLSQDRFIFERYSKRYEYLASYNRVDMALDPFPFPGGTTSIEGLWMGVPVLTLKGDRFISHQGESIAHNVGLSNWIALNINDYVAKAEQFARNVNALSALRDALREQLLNSPLCDTKRFAQHFEDAMWGMWKKST